MADNTKTCSRCGMELPQTREFYYIFPSGKFFSMCRDCQRENHRQWRAENPERSRESSRKSVRKHRENNYEAALAYNREWCANNPDKVEAYRLRANERNRDGRKDQRRHGIAPDQTAAMEEFQEFGCAICGCPISRYPAEGQKKRNIDHDHYTGLVRGLLCGNCNAKLGWFEHNAVMILNYLECPPATQLGFALTTDRRREDPMADTHSNRDK